MWCVCVFAHSYTLRAAVSLYFSAELDRFQLLMAFDLHNFEFGTHRNETLAYTATVFVQMQAVNRSHCQDHGY